MCKNVATNATNNRSQVMSTVYIINCVCVYISTGDIQLMTQACNRNASLAYFLRCVFVQMYLEKNQDQRSHK